jgi:hypothetical protein
MGEIVPIILYEKWFAFSYWSDTQNVVRMLRIGLGLNFMFSYTPAF